METIVNMDCDFVYDSASDTSVAPRKHRICDPAKFAGLVRLAGPGEPRLCLDHHEVLAEWDRIPLRDAVCVHIDAHHDLYSDFNRAWELPLGTRGSHVGAGDYLFHALREAYFERIVWVTPEWLDVNDAARDVCLRVGTVLAQRVSIVPISEYRWQLPPARRCYVALSPEWTPACDLEIHCDTARRLGASPTALGAWRGAAVERYRRLSSGESALDLRYRFPYPRTADTLPTSLRGQDCQ